MPAIFDRVLTVNLIANTAIFYVAARLYLLPLVPRVRPQQILVPISHLISQESMNAGRGFDLFPGFLISLEISAFDPVNSV